MTHLVKILEVDYKDTKSLYALCRAHIYYDKGSAVYAYGELRYVMFRYQPDARMKVISKFREVLNEAYNASRKSSGSRSWNYSTPGRRTPVPTASPRKNWSHPKRTPSGPSTDGFVHPEDFYDWYYDDFWDYEEAEEYYYSHGGK